MNSDFIKQLEENFLSCKICEEEVKANETELKLLPCQHSLCGKCLNEMLKKKCKVTCPFCRKDFPVPKSAEFPLFRYAAELSEFLEANIDTKYQIPATPEPLIENKANSSTILLGEFSYASVDRMWFCWGKSGTLYTNNHPTNPAEYGKLYRMNILKGKLKRFGHLDSQYAKGLFIGGELYIFNTTKKYVEVYKDERLVRKWCIKWAHTPILMMKHPVEGILLLCSTNMFFAFQHYDYFGRKISDDGSLQELIRVILPAIVEYPQTMWLPYQGSLWFQTKEYIYEIETYKTNKRIGYKKPVKRIKIPAKYHHSYTWRNGVLIFADQLSGCLRVLDLADVSLTSPAPNRSSHPRRRGSSSTVQQLVIGDNQTKILVHKMDSKDSYVAASDDNFLAVSTENNTLIVYKVQRGESAKDRRQINISETVMPEPEYLTVTERLDRMSLPIRNWCDSTFTMIARLILAIIVTLVLTYFICFPDARVDEDFQHHLRHACSSGTLQQASYGWSNLYISVCDYQTAVAHTSRK